MKQLFLNRGQILLEDVPTPIVQDNGVLVKVYYSFISSGTEISTINESGKSVLQKFVENSSKSVDKIIGAVKSDGILGTLALIKGKLNEYSSLGYSCSGKVIAVGKNVKNLKIGDFVACAGSGFANHSEIVSVPVNLAVKVSNSNYLKEASLTTIGAIAMQAIRRAELGLGEKVCVYGLGLIGQIVAQLCKISGCQVFGIDLKKERIEQAKKQGIDFVFNAENNDFLDQINFFTNHLGVDTTIITASSADGFIIDNSMNITRRKGKVVLVGDVKIDFNRDPFYSKEIDFLISCSYGPGRYDAAYEKKGLDYPYSYVRWTENRNMELFVDLIEKKKTDFSFLTSQEFNFFEAEKAFSHLKKGSCLGAVLSFDKNVSSSLLKEITERLEIGTYQDFDVGRCEPDKILKAIPYNPKKGKLNVGFIGVGGFAKVKLLPIISKKRDLVLHTLVDTNSVSLLNISKVYNVNKITNNAAKIFADDDINMVFIATPHKYHFNQTIEALKHGKAVFVEKPAVINFEQFNKLNEFLKLNENCFYCVDFNRSFAPFNLIIKEEISLRKNPVIINYTVNAGYIPSDHWIQDEQNGGRIIGEACHIFELFCFLTDSSPVSVAVQTINGKSEDVNGKDNFVVSVVMKDGSCCNLVYSSIGNREMSKESMKILFDGKSITMKDYYELKGYGLPVSFNRKTRFADKGHENLINEFVSRAKMSNVKPPIPIDRILNATKLSLIVDKLVRNKGGFEYFDF